jgi:hypothetical protein
MHQAYKGIIGALYTKLELRVVRIAVVVRPCVQGWLENLGENLLRRGNVRAGM